MSWLGRKCRERNPVVPSASLNAALRFRLHWPSRTTKAGNLQFREVLDPANPHLDQLSCGGMVEEAPDTLADNFAIPHATHRCMLFQTI
jgi:hypothetical protein